MRVAVGAVTQTGLPVFVPSLLPGPQPTTASVVNESPGNKAKPQLYAASEEGFAPAVQIAKNFWALGLVKRAPEFLGIVNWNVLLAGMLKLPAPETVP